MAAGAPIYIVVTLRDGRFGLRPGVQANRIAAHLARSNIQAGTAKPSYKRRSFTVGNTRLRRFGEKEPPSEIAEGALKCRERLGGLLKHYYRQAA